MSARPPDDTPAADAAALAGASEPSFEAAQNEDIDAVTVGLAEDARRYAALLSRCTSLAARASASGRGSDRRFLVMELAGSWRIAQVTAARWIEDAERFAEALPLTLRLLEEGRLFRHQAQTLLHRTRSCTPGIAQAVEAELLPEAVELCPSDLSKRVDRAVLRHESASATPGAAEQRHTRAAAGRRVWTRSEADGMALVGAVLTAEQTVAFSRGLDVLERRERCADRDAGVDRTVDQRRADLLAALPAMVLAGTAQDQQSRAEGVPGRPWTLGPEQLAAQVVLNIHVPVSTVLELSREPGSLTGYGPVSAEHVRLVRPHAVRRVLVDAASGRPVAVDDRATPAASDRQAFRRQVRAMLRPDVVVDRDEPQHDPSARLARLVDVRDVHCSGPGCASSRTDRDHHQPWPSGPTSASNLHRLSPRCHAAKHSGWQLVRHPDGGTTWTSPLRRTYRRPGPHSPPPRVDLYDEPPLRPVRELRETEELLDVTSGNGHDVVPDEPSSPAATGEDELPPF